MAFTILFPLLAGYSAIIYELVWFRVIVLQIGAQPQQNLYALASFLVGLSCAPLVYKNFSSLFNHQPARVLLGTELSLLCIGFMTLGSLSMSLNHLLAPQALFFMILLNGIFVGITHFGFLGFLQKQNFSIESANAILFFIYNLGCGLSALAFPYFLVPLLGLKNTLLHAIILNLLLAYALYRNILRAPLTPATTPSLHSQKKSLFHYIMAFTCGFVLLAQEAIWLRTSSFINKSWSISFYLVFAAIFFGFSLGYAIYILKNKSWQKTKNTVLVTICLFLLLNQISQQLLPVLSTFHSSLAILFFYISIIHSSAFLTLATASLVKIFTPTDDINQGYTKFIFCNVIGAIIGLLFVSQVLFPFFSLPQLNLILSLIVIVPILFFINPFSSKQRFAMASLVVGIALLSRPQYYFEKIIFKTTYTPQSKVSFLAENAYGVLLVADDPLAKGHFVIGNGAYDGRFNTRLDVNSNGIDRTFKIGALHLAPHKVLQIGLGSGSWSEILLSNQQVQQLDIVEINAAYLELIQKSDHAGILQDPRVHVSIEDARQWLRTNVKPDQYDLIVMNTTYHWRYGVNNLVSQEFLRLCKKVLKHNGVLYLNTTHLEAITETLASEFKFVTTYDSFSAASNEPFPMDSKLITQSVKGFSLFNSQITLSTEFWKNESFLTKKKSVSLQIITDDNLASEL